MLQLAASLFLRHHCHYMASALEQALTSAGSHLLGQPVLVLVYGMSTQKVITWSPNNKSGCLLQYNCKQEEFLLRILKTCVQLTKRKRVPELLPHLCEGT